jgi:hypothetical protein
MKNYSIIKNNTIYSVARILKNDALYWLNFGFVTVLLTITNDGKKIQVEIL